MKTLTGEIADGEKQMKKLSRDIQVRGACVSVCICVYMCVCVCVCMCVHICVCVCIYVCTCNSCSMVTSVHGICSPSVNINMRAASTMY